jgi:hypothetical protein
MRAALLASLVVLLSAPALLALPGTADDPSQLLFGAPALIDDVRAGGEPVLAELPGGTLIVVAHPGFTHLYRNLPHVPVEALQDYGGESYLWRSTDGGASWQHVGLPLLGLGLGPRSATVGQSDPDLTVDANGRVYMTDLYLASAAVAWSDDAGQTWLPGNAAAAGVGPVDRQWLASFGSKVYFTASYFRDHHASRSDDGGLTWTNLGNVPCSGDFVAAPDGTLYAACSTGVATSTNGGTTWAQRRVPGHTGSGLGLREPAVDGAGNVWSVWQESESRVYLAGSPDEGVTWPWVLDLTPQVRAALGNPSQLTVVWPFVSAGSDGRVAVTLYATPTPPPSAGGALDRPWSVVAVAVFGADTASPAAAGYVVKANHHLGPVCQSGTTCLVGSIQGDPSRDRRMGDFFETTIGRDGMLRIAYSDTTAHPDDWISHPGFARQVGGPRFVVDGFAPTQG